MTSNTTSITTYDDLFTAEEEAILARKEADAERLSERNGRVPEALAYGVHSYQDDAARERLAA